MTSRHTPQDLTLLQSQLLEAQQENLWLKEQLSDVRKYNADLKAKSDVTSRLHIEIVNLISDYAEDIDRDQLMSLSPLLAFNRLRSQLSVLNEFREKFDAELGTLITCRGHQLQATIDEQSRELRITKDSLVAAEQSLSMAQSKVFDLEIEKNNLQRLCDELQANFAEKEANFLQKIATLHEQLNSTSNENNSNLSKIKYLDIKLLRVEQLESALAVEKMQRNQAIKKAESTYKVQIDHLTAELARLNKIETDNHKLKGQLRQQSERLRSYQKNLAIVRDQDQSIEIQRLQGVIKRKEELISELQSELRSTLALSEQVSVRNQTLKKKFSEISHRAREQKSVLKQREEAAVIDSITAKTEATVLQDQLSSTKAKAEQLSSQVKNLLQSKNFSSLKLEKERQRREALFNEIGELRKQRLALSEASRPGSPISPHYAARPLSAPILTYSVSSPAMFESPSPSFRKNRPQSSLAFVPEVNTDSEFDD
ncbi:hypothetical protein RCL1_001390 [Eukaryota sp. TZLM3-RCL]